MKKRSKVIIWFLAVLCLGILFYCVYANRTSRPNDAPVVQEELTDVEAPLSSQEVVSAWMELPGASEMIPGRHVVTHKAQMAGRLQRNYTILYDENLYAALWVAYPLCASHTSSGREETWGYDPQVPKSSQTSVKAGYGASEPTANYPKNFYARGHQIPNADRSAIPEMQAQTYYSTNMTPQLQNGFNGHIWAKLEDAVRSLIPAGDTLYVVTGAVFEKDGMEESVKTIQNKNDSKSLPVPNYYWKALLKVKREGGAVTDAAAIGFWLPHADLKGHSYEDYAVSVDEIESWTGFDMFPSLPDRLEAPVESKSSWEVFRSFM